jgi:hypothetical protein
MQVSFINRNWCLSPDGECESISESYSQAKEAPVDLRTVALQEIRLRLSRDALAQVFAKATKPVTSSSHTAASLS